MPAQPTASTNSQATGFPAASRHAEIEQVLEVLRGTDDGDLLAPRDLKLSEHVANYGRSALTEAARARWDQVVDMVHRGQYVKPWLHGVENLTKDHAGYVLWRGKAIEHYAFADQERERSAAQVLGACCRFLEARGRAVSSAEIFKAYDEARHGEGFGVRRWAVHWLTGPHQARIAVVELEFEYHDEACRAMASSAENRKREWGASGDALRSFKVVTQEDFDSACEQLQQACDWAMRSLAWQQYSNGRHRSEFLQALQGAIRREELPSAADLVQRYFAGEGEEPAAYRSWDREGRVA